MVIEGLKTVTQLDITSKSILPIIRYFYLSLNEPSSHGWRHGFDCAVGTWGQNRGLAIAYATQKFVCDLLRCNIILTIFDPLDIEIREVVGPDEDIILRLLSYMRNDDTSKARRIISELSQGYIDPVFVRHGFELAATLDGKPQGFKTPQLRMIK